MPVDAQSLHADAIIIDPVCPLLHQKDMLDVYKKGGLTAIAPTVGGWENAATTMRGLGSWVQYIRERGDAILVRSAADIEEAKRTNKIGVIFHFQGTDPLEDSLDLVDAYKSLGVGMIQLTYNVKNRVGDGCEERTDAGLSKFGLKAIARMNQARIIVDCSHTGYRTTMDAFEASSAPTVFSHANPRAVYGTPRNVLDEQIKAAAATGGLTGIVGFPPFVAADKRPTLDQFIDHISYVADLVGIDHVALGIDYFLGQSPYTPDDAAMKFYEETIASGRWTPAAYPPPPYYYPEGIGTPDQMPNLTAALVKRGFSEADIRKILGGNWMRVFRAVWGS
ncbi:dipeptidase [Ferrovibrio sp.]|uniref:dipeptidase n=1 Tax=Ferrovibrio sp. TaxID=1917215 RepID=UPI0035B25657